jgi:hypothetical protein
MFVCVSLSPSCVSWSVCPFNRRSSLCIRERMAALAAGITTTGERSTVRRTDGRTDRRTDRLTDRSTDLLTAGMPRMRGAVRLGVPPPGWLQDALRCALRPSALRSSLRFGAGLRPPLPLALRRGVPVAKVLQGVRARERQGFGGLRRMRVPVRVRVCLPDLSRLPCARQPEACPFRKPCRQSLRIV